MSRLLFFFCAAVILHGCSSSSRVSIGTISIDAQETQRTVETNRQRVHSLYAQGQLSVESSEGAQSGSFRLFFIKPDSLLIEVLGPFGLRVGSGIISRSTFSFFNAIQNKVYVGVTTPETLSKILQVRVSFDDIADLITGGSFSAMDRRPSDDATMEDEQCVFTYRECTGSRQYWIDPTSQLIRRTILFDADKRVLREERFADFRKQDDVVIPYSVRVILPKERNMLLLTFGDVTINAAESPFQLIIPDNASRVLIR